MGFRHLFRRKTDTKELHPTNAEEPQGETRVTVIRDGDLFLKVCGRHTDIVHLFRVSSAVLASKSTAFDRILNGQARVERPLNPMTSWVVTLEDTRPRQVEQFLQLIHGNTGNFTLGSPYGAHYVEPDGVERLIGDIYHLLVITERYSCTRLLQPFAARMVDILDQPVDLRRRHQIMLAYIYFTLGRQAHFEDIVTRLILTASPISQAKANTSLLVPSGFLDTIEDGRVQAAARLLYPLTEQKRLYERDDRFPNHFCNRNYNFRACEDRVLSSVLRKLNKMGVWPDVDTNKLTTSPIQLLEKLLQIKTAPTLSVDQKFLSTSFDYAEEVGGEYGVHTSLDLFRADAFRYKATSYEVEHFSFQTAMLRPWLDGQAWSPHWQRLQGQRIMLCLSSQAPIPGAPQPHFYFKQLGGRGAFDNDDDMWFSDGLGIIRLVDPSSRLAAHAITTHWTEMIFSAGKIQAAVDSMWAAIGRQKPRPVPRDDSRFADDQANQAAFIASI